MDLTIAAYNDIMFKNMNTKGDDEEFVLYLFQREMAVGASQEKVFTFVASEPGGRKLLP